MAFLGMRGNGDWVNNARPENWRQMILRLFPNGMTPLTGITSMIGSEGTNDPTIHWWTQNLATQAGALVNAGVYTDNALTNLYVEGVAAQPAAGDVFYVKCSASLASDFRIGHTVALEKSGDYRYMTRGKVVGVDANNGNLSYVAVKLLEASSDTYDIDEVNRIAVIGNVNPEGGDRPNAIAYDPVEFYNYTQIFRTPLSITNTAKATNLRTGNGYQEAKKDTLEYHSIEMEKAMIWGIRSSGTGANGKPERTMDGIVTMLRRNSTANGNVSAFGHDAPYNTNGWLTLSDGLPIGEEWFDAQLERAFRFGSNEKLMLCGSGAMHGINRLAKVSGDIQLTPMTTEYGLRVTQWNTPYGTVFLKTHPLFSQNPQYRHDALLLEPSEIKVRPLQGNGVNRDTHFVESPPEGAENGRDSTEEEYKTEMTLEVHHLPKHAYLSRIGLDHDEAIASV